MADNKDQKEVTQTQKCFLFLQCFFWIYHLAVVALGFAIFSQVVITYQSGQKVLNSNQYQHSLETIWLWNQGYLIDIQVENTNNCPEGYTPLLNYKWSGTNDGCYCHSNSNGYTFDFVLLGKCSSNLISLGCQTVSAIEAQIMSMWKGGSLICEKRAKSMNFYNSIITTAPSGGSSPTMTVCAFNQTYQSYTLPGVSCPITAASNSSLGVNQTQLILDDEGIYQFNFAKETGYPIAAFKLTEYQFCQFFNDSNISPMKEGTYILQIQSLSNPCPKTDPRIVTFDQVNEEDFYTNNTRVYQLISSLPAYPTPSVAYQFPLGYISYPSWTYACRISSGYNLKIATDQLMFLGSTKALKIVISITVPCLLVWIILFRLFYIIRYISELKSKCSFKAIMLTEDEIVQQIPNLNIKKSFKRQFILFLIECLMICAVFASVVYAIIELTSNSLWIKAIINNHCTDDYLNNIFRYYESNTDQISIRLVEVTFIWVVLFFMHLLHFILRYKFGDLSSKVQIVEVESNYENLNMLNKQLNLEENSHNQLQDSSEVILNKESNELKVYDMDYLMNDFNGGETKDNFYESVEPNDAAGLVKKKKKKKVTKRRKNLFKDDQN